MVKQVSDDEIYLLIKYIKSVLWRVVKRLSYTGCIKMIGAVSICRYDFQNAHRSKFPI